MGHHQARSVAAASIPIINHDIVKILLSTIALVPTAPRAPLTAPPGQRGGQRLSWNKVDRQVEGARQLLGVEILLRRNANF